MARKRTANISESKVGCKGCGVCTDKSFCQPWKGALGDYGVSAIRYTADGFDCALPISIDTYNTCSYRCMYCFSNYLLRDPHRKRTFNVKAIKLNNLKRFLEYEIVDRRMDRKILDEVGGENTSQCPVQWGALGDPFDCIERQHGVGLQMMDLFTKYEQPVRISTKGATLIIDKHYIDKFRASPELYWVAFSLITIDDAVLEKIDKDTPNASQRLKAMKILSDIGVKTSLRLRPILPGITDRTAMYKKAWRDLLRKARDAGAISLSMEFSFVPGIMPAHVRKMWQEINNICGYDLVRWYKVTSVHGACLRSSRSWKEELTFAIYEEAKELGFNFGISDPHWKELNDFGCCCGIPADDPYFGGWMRKNATEALLKAKKGKLISAKDGIPKWAYKIPMQDMVVMTGAKNAYKRATMLWSDKLRNTWNDLHSARGALNYFEGVLFPVDRDEHDNILYKYEPFKRTYKESPHFRV